MSEDRTLAARMDALEILVAHQEQTIQDLNETVTRQWSDIERLSRWLAEFVDRLNEAENKADQAGAPEPPPPHY